MLIQMLRKEFILILRDKHSLAALYIMPFLFILIMSLALKDTFNNQHALLNVEIIDLDKSHESKMLQDFMETSAFLHKRTEDDKEEPHITLSIPQGFASNLLQKDRTEALLKLTAAPDVKSEMVLIFRAKLTADIMTLRLMQIQKEIAPLLPITEKFPDISAYQTDNLLQINYKGMQDHKPPTSTQQSVPSWIVFGMFFVIIPMSTIFIGERKQNTLMRMASMNISIPVLFTGKIIPYIIINQFQVILMICAGVFVVPLLGGDALSIGHSLSGLILVSTSLSIAATGTSVLIAILADTVEQATTIGGLLNILLGAIGGVMVPKIYMPQAMQTFSNFSPMSWGLEGFLDIFLRGYGIMDVIPESLALCSFGLSLLLLAAFIFSKRLNI